MGTNKGQRNFQGRISGMRASCQPSWQDLDKDHRSVSDRPEKEAKRLGLPFAWMKGILRVGLKWATHRQCTGAFTKCLLPPGSSPAQHIASALAPSQSAFSPRKLSSVPLPSIIRWRYKAQESRVLPISQQRDQSPDSLCSHSGCKCSALPKSEKLSF